jgi:transcriptional regulator with XRE-family HTH domain
MKTLGDRIREERENKGWSQTELGKRVGVGKSSVSQWENGTTKKMDGLNMVLAAKALGLSADWLATGKGNKYRTPEPEKTISAIHLLNSNNPHIIDVSELNEKDRNLVKDMVQRLKSEQSGTTAWRGEERRINRNSLKLDKK